MGFVRLKNISSPEIGPFPEMYTYVIQLGWHPLKPVYVFGIALESQWVFQIISWVNLFSDFKLLWNVLYLI